MAEILMHPFYNYDKKNSYFLRLFNSLFLYQYQTSVPTFNTMLSAVIYTNMYLCVLISQINTISLFIGGNF